MSCLKDWLIKRSRVFGPRLQQKWISVSLTLLSTCALIALLFCNRLFDNGRGSLTTFSTTKMELIIDPQFREAALDKDNVYLYYLASICPPGVQDKRIILDVGGNKGYSLLRYGFLWGNLDHAIVLHHVQSMIRKTNMWRGDHGLEVHVFEPSNSAYEVLSILKENLPFYRLFLHRMAVSSEEGYTELVIPYDNVGDEGGAIAVGGHIPGLPVHSKERIKMTTLDNFYSATFKNNEIIEYIKIDVEGFESHVLSGMGQIISKRLVKAFEFEFGPAWYDGRTGEPQSLRKAVADLYEKDYACYFIVAIEGITKFVHISPVHWQDEFESVSRCNVFCIDTAMRCFEDFENVATIK